MAPTYIAATLGPYFVAFFCIAIVLLAYDLRERDLRCRIIEVLEVVPASNVVVVMGRLLGFGIATCRPDSVVCNFDRFVRLDCGGFWLRLWEPH